MGEIIRDWLRTRLGIIIDLSPEIFGHFARDGTLLAKVLHSYDVINDSQLSTLLQTQDPALSRVNLKHLRVWLKFVGVDCDNDCIEDISNGKGTMALRLFYKVFLCLENKDRLHFITLQKEREKYIPSSSKFDVTKVSEEPEVEESDDRAYAALLRKSASLIDWQRRKYEKSIDARKREDKFSPPENDDKAPETTTSGTKKKSVSRTKKTGALARRSELRELDEFAKKHRVKGSKETPEARESNAQQSPGKSIAPKIDEEAARAYTESLRNKHRQEALTKSFKTRMQKNLLDDLWKKVLDDQEMEFDEIIAKKVLHQSQYEKQLIRKLCDVRSQKKRMAANRGIVERLVEETRENEMRLDQERAREVMVRENEEVEAERRRIEELERRIEEQSRRRKDAKIRRFAEKIFLDLVDIAVKVCRYKIESNEDQVPKSLMNQWKVLFLNNRSIIEAQNEVSAREELEKEDDGAEIEMEDEGRTKVLNNEDFENYHRMHSPWKDFVPNVDDEVREYLNLGLLVLGHIVHKTLKSRDSEHRTESVESSLPAMRIRAAVVGIPDSLLYEPIQELLNNSNVRLVRIEEAINHCLSRYKAEMRDFEYIDLEIISATREARNSSSIPSEADEDGKKQRKNKKTSSGKSKTASSTEKIEKTTESRKKGTDKVTQTPRVIPHEDKDPLLSNAAYFGKWIHEFLTLGQPLSDELISRTIVEYLRSLENIRGFVLVNYPNTYRETSLLEFVLGGRRLPEKRVKSWNETGNGSIEDIDSYVPRIIFEDESSDSEAWTESRLVPNPTRSVDPAAKSCLTSFVRIEEKSTDRKKEDDDIWEIISDDGTSVDAFYADQEIASILYYRIFDLATLKKLVRLVVSGRNELISGASSYELFGDYLRYFEGRREEDYSPSGAAIAKKLLPSRASEYSSGESRSTSSIESRKSANVEESTFPGWKEGSALPGAVDWPWANFPQPQNLVHGLGDLWRSLETSYVENLKETFHLKRMNFNAGSRYVDFMTRHMREFINRPDEKQDLLHEFHRAFNEIDREIRDDSSIVRQLYCRIDDFETRLWEICDARRRQAEDEKRRIIEEHWTSGETIDIANIYIDILQFEIDRCNETLQFVNDYYTSMLQRPLQEIRASVSLSRIETGNLDSRQEIASRGSAISAESGDGRGHKEARAKSTDSQIPRAPIPPDENLVKSEIAKILSDVDEGNFAATRTLCYKAVEENIRFVNSVVESLAARVLDGLKREEARTVKSPSEDRKRSARKNARSIEFQPENDRKLVENLILEWRYAFMFEINRIRVRLKMLDAAARSDMDRLLGDSKKMFSDIQRRIIDRYDREVKSVNDMASTFRYAIEEARPIQEEMLLDGDRFLVRSNVLMFPDEPDVAERAARRRDVPPPSRFSASQLSRLAEIFLRSAPSGILAERSFVYIIQDLIVCDDDRGENSILPSPWYQLRACDVSRLVDELFGEVEYVDWREFIVYALGIDAPSVDEILRDYRGFRKIDDKFEEFVSREDFASVRLWFHAGEPRSQGEEEEQPREENLEEDQQRTDEQLRPEGIKKLLGHIFSYDDARVNYVALLMAFCKDETPEIGLGKALSLAAGDRVCADWEIGEEYARESPETKLASVETNGSDARREATKISRAIVNWMLENFLRSIEIQGVKKVGTTINEPEDSASLEKFEQLNAGEELIVRNDDFRSEDGKFPASDGSQDTLTFDRGKKNSRLSEERSMIYWLDFNVAQTILAAMLPSHAAQQNILETGKSLRENLELVRLQLLDQGMNDEAGAMILSHRFIHHDFVKKLLADTSKFTMHKLSNMIEKIINDYH